MAYCKSCGKPIKDGEVKCVSCGTQSALADLDESGKVVIIKGSAEDAQPKDDQAAVFRVFDRRVIILLVAFFGVAALTVALRLLSDDPPGAAYYCIYAVAAVAVCVLVFAGVMHYRKWIVFGMILTAVFGVAGAAVILATAEYGTTAVWIDVSSAAIALCLACSAITVACEMKFGFRRLGTHSILVILTAIAIFTNIILTLMTEMGQVLDPTATAYQGLAVVGKLLILTLMFMMFSNMGRVALKDKF